MTLSLGTVYRSFGVEVEAPSTPTICRLPDSRRHQLWAIAPPIGGKQPYSRKTSTFQSEIEAKNFAKEKLQSSRNVNAGTLNPFLPKRVITSAQIYEWLEAH